MENELVSRRDFLAGLTLAGASAALAAPATGAHASDPAQPWPLIVFSKAFQSLNPDETADLIAEVGWDGIECPVRRDGQVLPERVEDDLPKMVEALGRRGKRIYLMATDVRQAGDSTSENVLRTASKLGIPGYRLGSLRYTENQSIPAQLRELRAQMQDLAALNRELRLCGGIQNHSGANYVGAPVWDIYELIQGLDPKHLGICFDIGHATVEGGYAWPLHARLMQPLFSSVFVKDFVWQQTANGWRASWCPLGQGMVQRRFFSTLAKSNFRGPINQHFEYTLPDLTPSARRQLIRVLKQDLETLRSWLS